MVINVIDNPFHYEMEKLTAQFFPFIRGKVNTEPPFLYPDDDFTIDVKMEELSGDDVFMSVTYSDPGNNVYISKSERAKNKKIHGANDAELCAARLLYEVLSEVSGVTLNWGVLTGVRPSKVMHNMINELGEEGALLYFEKSLLVSKDKAKLALSVAKAETEIMSRSKPENFSFYVSIPFCPGRCSYCSFVSSAVNKDSVKTIIPTYFENLIKEIKYTGELSKNAGLKMLSAYVGGGTPGVLTARQIDELLLTVRSSYDLSECKEFTFEAGRPDTITMDKLHSMKNGGIDRISINPQTMDEKILHAVGRNHSIKEVYDSFDLAREAGFSNINMDLIAGLPGDTLKGFERSVMELCRLSPESITVHTLAYKRSSDLELSKKLFANGNITREMVNRANEILYENGYIPYYMYRQAKTVGNLENVGWCKPGYESIYNIYMMEECHSIFACGAGAVTKLQKHGEKKIERIYNYKYPYEYNNQFEEIMNRKKPIKGFF